MITEVRRGASFWRDETAPGGLSTGKVPFINVKSNIHAHRLLTLACVFLAERCDIPATAVPGFRAAIGVPGATESRPPVVICG